MKGIAKLFYPVLTTALTAVLTISTFITCLFIVHQPVMEEGIEDFKKCK